MKSSKQHSGARGGEVAQTGDGVPVAARIFSNYVLVPAGRGPDARAPQARMHGAGLLVFADKSQQQIKLRPGQSTRFASQVAAKARPTEKLINEFNGDHKSPSEQQTVNSGRLKAEAEERMETEIRDQRASSTSLAVI